MEYIELRKEYPVFYYHGFSIVESDTELHICYDFEIQGLSHFNPDYVIPKPKGSEEVGTYKNIREAAFQLGMIELISYWKLTCSPNVIVECGTLDEKQLKWWKHLYFNGLGEFFYVNNIEADPKTFMFIVAIGSSFDGIEDKRSYKGNLIPIGGGKDSFVTLSLLDQFKEDNAGFIINHIISAKNSAEVAGYKNDSLIVIERSLDQRMLEFNRQGYLNGHTPFSALAAFASSLTAMVYGFKNITLSNEASANESTIKDSKVNHQYSKTFEFEEDFKWYMDEYVCKNVHYFSLLRPLTELQIAGIFATLSKDVHETFRSCNVGSKQGVWCGHCAKCLFVYILLSAYLDDEQLIHIFGVDMLNDESLMDLFKQLSGLVDDKPFECVGTRDEVNIAVCMSIENHKHANKEIPYLYKQYMQSNLYKAYANKKVDMLYFNEENLLPECYKKVVKDRLVEVKGIWNL